MFRDENNSFSIINKSLSQEILQESKKESNDDVETYNEPKVHLVRSRINEFIPVEVSEEIRKITHDVTTSDNNEKSKRISDTLRKHDINFIELGTGTNRKAVLIDGYVFKIAMDFEGERDNANEYAMSKELQPFVVKVYETNDLICVTEYITLISRDEFNMVDKKFEILNILSQLSGSYLLGDVGYDTKNFANWGSRDNGQLVILDFAYIYRVQGPEMYCTYCENSGFLQYDSLFNSLQCSSCGRTQTFSEVRSRITTVHELGEINRVKEASYLLEGVSRKIISDGTETKKKGSNNMEKYKKVEPWGSHLDTETVENSLDNMIELIQSGDFNSSQVKEINDLEEANHEEVVEEVDSPVQALVDFIKERKEEGLMEDISRDDLMRHAVLESAVNPEDWKAEAPPLDVSPERRDELLDSLIQEQYDENHGDNKDEDRGPAPNVEGIRIKHTSLDELFSSANIRPKAAYTRRYGRSNSGRKMNNRNNNQHNKNSHHNQNKPNPQHQQGKQVPNQLLVTCPTCGKGKDFRIQLKLDPIKCKCYLCGARSEIPTSFLNEVDLTTEAGINKLVEESKKYTLAKTTKNDHNKSLCNQQNVSGAGGKPSGDTEHSQTEKQQLEEEQKRKEKEEQERKKYEQMAEELGYSEDE